MDNHEEEKETLIAQSRAKGANLTDVLCDDLLPCAHCGGVGLLEQEKSNNGEGGWYIECANPTCRMTTPLRYSCGDGVEELLAEIWNRRTQSHNVQINRQAELGRQNGE